jgi:hypothetical protein
VGHGGRPAGMRGWQGQPRKMAEYEHWRKKQRNIRSSGCGLQVGGAESDLLAIRPQSSNTLFSAARTSNSRCLVLYLVQRCKMRCACHFFFERSCPEQRPRAALKPQEPHSPLERALYPGRPRPRREVLASRGVVLVVESWQGQAAGAISVVGKAVLTPIASHLTHPETS